MVFWREEPAGRVRIATAIELRQRGAQRLLAGLGFLAHRMCLSDMHQRDTGQTGLTPLAVRAPRQAPAPSVRALARKYGVHRRTVREALASAWPDTG